MIEIVEPLIRKAIYKTDRILPHILASYNGKGPGRIDLNNDSVSVSSVRLHMFAIKGIVCVGWKKKCRVKGSFFAKEKQNGSEKYWHLNLYALKKDGTEMLMTRDHIIPKSKGGGNGISNSQPMCFECNNKKGNTMELYDENEQ